MTAYEVRQLRETLVYLNAGRKYIDEAQPLCMFILETASQSNLISYSSDILEEIIEQIVEKIKVEEERGL